MRPFLKLAERQNGSDFEQSTTTRVILLQPGRGQCRPAASLGLDRELASEVSQRRRVRHALSRLRGSPRDQYLTFHLRQSSLLTPGHIPLASQRL